MQRIHLIGIGGSGLSAIAYVLLEKGYEVSGSDRVSSTVTERLRESGAQIFEGHHPNNVVGVDLVLRSSAVLDDNIEVQAAYTARIPVIKRAEFLDQLTQDQLVIAIAGTHGKTTTTAMVAWLLVSLGEDPSYIIGGVSKNLGANAHAGEGSHFVIEADEYDRMFLGLHPYIAVITNIEHDHPDCYPTLQDFHMAFDEFLGNVQSGGRVVFCGDDTGARELVSNTAVTTFNPITYGIEDSVFDYWAFDPEPNNVGGYTFNLMIKENKIEQPVVLQVPGKHNVRNSLAALVIVDHLNLPLRNAIKALSEFQGVDRRFELRGEVAGVIIVDDYAHHPTEIRATLEAARARFSGREIWVVWQPHTYSRTRTLLADFQKAFDNADHLIVTEIFASRESPPEDGFSSARISEGIRMNQGKEILDVQFIPELSDSTEYLLKNLKPSDVVIVMSAGNADFISAELLRLLPDRSSVYKRK